MGKTLALGRRIEILPLDPHCHSISLGLYREEVESVPLFTVHTYSSVGVAQERVGFIIQTLITMLGMEEAPNRSRWIRFPCLSDHERPLKRAFLDLCKLETGEVVRPKPLTAMDKKAGGNLTVVSMGDGRYRIEPEADCSHGPKRAAALVRGFVKLCELETAGEEENQVAFPCKQSHDQLMGMLMFRAQNVRASMQELESNAGRGVLAPPSQQ